MASKAQADHERSPQALEPFLLALIGHPVSHSLSPLMHRAALAHFQLSGDYTLLDLAEEQLVTGIDALKSKHYAGFNVTVPHKQSVIKLMDRLTQEAMDVRAVNTVKIGEDGTLTGHNTDLGGFTAALAEVFPAKSAAGFAVVIGSGGAARAALAALRLRGFTRIALLARNLASAEILKSQFCLSGKSVDLTCVAVDADPLAMPSADLIVNTTPIGLTDKCVPSWFSDLLARSAGAVFYDMVYAGFGKQSLLLAEAQKYELGACADGISMLVYQACLSFEFWTGFAPPVEVIRKALS